MVTLDLSNNQLNGTLYGIGALVNVDELLLANNLIGYVVARLNSSDNCAHCTNVIDSAYLFFQGQPGGIRFENSGQVDSFRFIRQ